MNEKELLKLKEKVSKAKETTLKLKGELAALMTQLKKEWDCATIEEGKALLRRLEKKNKKIDEKIENGTKDLEKKL